MKYSIKGLSLATLLILSISGCNSESTSNLETRNQKSNTSKASEDTDSNNTSNLESNTTDNTFESNTTDNTFESNTTDNTFESNTTDNTFESNTTDNTFESNTTDNTFESNTTDDTESNKTDNTFESNTTDDTESNKTDNTFESNTTDDTESNKTDNTNNNSNASKDLSHILPINVTIDAPNLETRIISTDRDALQFNLAIDLQGVLDNGSNTLHVDIPYTVIGSSSSNATLPAYSTTYTIKEEDTEDGVASIVATFNWIEQNLQAGSGTFEATITTDTIYNAKKLNVQDDVDGRVVATFHYPKDYAGDKGTLIVKVLPGILDRNFNVQTNGTYEHRFVYLPVTNPKTGRTWLNNNLGAEYADSNNPNGNFNPRQQATATNDKLAYGSLFQWGRKADGHELINWNVNTNGEGKYTTTTTKSDAPDKLFILDTNDSKDWRVTRDDTLWASESSPNNVCPIGYRLPRNPNGANDVENEFYQLTKDWKNWSVATAFSSFLKLTATGIRTDDTGLTNHPNYLGVGNYWSGSVNRDGVAVNLYFWNNSRGSANDNTMLKAQGLSVRCIKQNILPKNDSLPTYIKIDNPSLKVNIVSLHDSRFTPTIDIQGVIDNGPHAIKVSVPYTARSSATLPAYSSEPIVIDQDNTEDGNRDITAIFRWSDQILKKGSGTFQATITTNTTYNAKKLDLKNIKNDQEGILIATFDYPMDTTQNKGTLELKIVPAIFDRKFNKATNGRNEHQFVYLPVTNPTTGRTWLNNNLGAEYADMNNPHGNYNPAQQAVTSNDTLAYGSLFQWGRQADGHELIRRGSANTGSAEYGFTPVASNDPSHSFFITSRNDWRVDSSDTLWARELSKNNICPVGYRLPLDPNGANDSENEWYQETQTWSSQDPSGAFNSVLKLSMSGFRSPWKNGKVLQEGIESSYWFGSANGLAANGLEAKSMDFYPYDVDSNVYSNVNSVKTNGFSVRCIKD